MPRLDPDSGCMAMTTMEFWQAEAEREGKEVGEVLDDFYKTMADEAKQEEARYRDNAEAIIKQAEAFFFEDDPDPSYIRTNLVLAVLRVSCNVGYSSSTKMLARVICEDKKERLLVYSNYHQPAAYIDPPDEGEDIEYYDTLEEATEAYRRKR